MVFRARDRMGLDAWVSVANKIALLGLALAALALGKGLPGVLVAQVLAGFLALAIAARLYRRVTTGPCAILPKSLARSWWAAAPSSSPSPRAASSPISTR